MTPRSLTFGQIDRNSEAKHKTVTITRGDGGPIAMELVPFEHKNVKASLREIEPGARYELDVELGPPWPNTTLRTNLTLKTGVPEAPEDIIKVYARIAPRLRASPARFTVPHNVEKERDLRVQLLWSGGDPGKILEVTTSDPQTSVRLEEQGDKQYVLLHVPAGYKPSTRGRPFVTVTTDDPQIPSYRIRVYAARAPTQRPHQSAKPTTQRSRRVSRVPTTMPSRPARQLPTKKDKAQDATAPNQE